MLTVSRHLGYWRAIVLIECRWSEGAEIRADDSMNSRSQQSRYHLHLVTNSLRKTTIVLSSQLIPHKFRHLKRQVRWNARKCYCRLWKYQSVECWVVKSCFVKQEISNVLLQRNKLRPLVFLRQLLWRQVLSCQCFLIPVCITPPSMDGHNSEQFRFYHHGVAWRKMIVALTFQSRLLTIVNVTTFE